MAKATKLPSGRWRVRTSEGGVRRSYTADTKKEAERLSAIGLAEDRASAARGMTLGEAIDAYIATCKAQGYSPATIAEYTARRRSSFPQLIDKPLRTLTAHDVQAQIDARAAARSVKTVRNDFFLMRAVLDVFAPNIDLRRIKLAKRQKHAKLIFPEMLPGKILSALSDEKSDLQIYAILAMFAGLRPSEVYALRWADISAEPITVVADPPFQVGEISVSAAEVRDERGAYQRKAPKTEAGNRVQTISWAVFERVYALKPRGASGDKIVEMNTKIAGVHWRHLRENGKLPEGLRLYDLRHYYATAVANSGASEEELAARMGHSTSAFSHQVYVELFEDRRRNVNEALAKATAATIKEVPNFDKMDTKLDTNNRLSNN